MCAKMALEVSSAPNQNIPMRTARLIALLCIGLVSLTGTSWSQKTPSDLRREAAVYERAAKSAQAKADAATDPKDKAAYVRRATVAQGMADSLHQEADRLEKAAK